MARLPIWPQLHVGLFVKGNARKFHLIYTHKDTPWELTPMNAKLLASAHFVWWCGQCCRNGCPEKLKFPCLSIEVGFLPQSSKLANIHMETSHQQREHDQGKASPRRNHNQMTLAQGQQTNGNAWKAKCGEDATHVDKWWTHVSGKSRTSNLEQMDLFVLRAHIPTTDLRTEGELPSPTQQEELHCVSPRPLADVPVVTTAGMGFLLKEMVVYLIPTAKHASGTPCWHLWHLYTNMGLCGSNWKRKQPKEMSLRLKWSGFQARKKQMWTRLIHTKRREHSSNPPKLECEWAWGWTWDSKSQQWHRQQTGRYESPDTVWSYPASFPHDERLHHIHMEPVFPPPGCQSVWQPPRRSMFAPRLGHPKVLPPWRQQVRIQSSNDLPETVWPLVGVRAQTW